MSENKILTNVLETISSQHENRFADQMFGKTPNPLEKLQASASNIQNHESMPIFWEIFMFVSVSRAY